MNEIQRTGFTERLKTASDARAALLAKFQPKPTVADPQFAERAVIRAVALQAVRAQRTDARAAAKQAAADVREAARLAEVALVDAELDARRGDRKERKALTKVEAKAKRDARYAARKAR